MFVLSMVDGRFIRSDGLGRPSGRWHGACTADGPFSHFTALRIIDKSALYLDLSVILNSLDCLALVIITI